MSKQASATRLFGTAALAALLGTIAAPSFAGNYAEGDPRPAPLASSTTRAAVTADAVQWLKTAPTQGYTSGYQQEPVAVSANSRAAVAADTRLWIQSGLAAQQASEAGADTMKPGYREAAAEYSRLRASPAYGALVDQLKNQQAAAQSQMQTQVR
ncbi:hypothetical protein ABL840_35305 [Variovorax sp. NFACC27]|uniref:hypothetical protein n=1 Tax=unclassified Variovorax TaxID=663243 RepID=UPI00089C26EF|nr:hypothetical protein SAMN03159371_06278 [Variovorax sp. NFACC28]SEG95804.1 hypothetical protein SAMN03159365_06356 [Variovorax sp. NFACC29]SFD79554.1 hypothetical protein SAMN03159379_06315 [Variovorax sp. NFACC26]SFG93031.1 hypothetical protein SAMN03159447_05658 [Variovorax sp. NFACC27]